MENIIAKDCHLLRVPVLRLFEEQVAGSLFFYHYLHLQQKRKSDFGRLLCRHLSDNSRAINNAMFVLLRSVVQSCTLSVHFPSPLHTADLGLGNQLTKRLRPFSESSCCCWDPPHMLQRTSINLPEEGEGSSFIQHA